jgi:hypothetical protein
MVYEFDKYSGTSTSLVPHFRTDLYTRTMLVYQKGDTRPTLVITHEQQLSVNSEMTEVTFGMCHGGYSTLLRNDDLGVSNLIVN